MTYLQALKDLRDEMDKVTHSPQSWEGVYIIITSENKYYLTKHPKLPNQYGFQHKDDKGTSRCHYGWMSLIDALTNGYKHQTTHLYHANGLLMDEEDLKLYL